MLARIVLAHKLGSRQACCQEVAMPVKHKKELANEHWLSRHAAELFAGLYFNVG